MGNRRREKQQNERDKREERTKRANENRSAKGWVAKREGGALSANPGTTSTATRGRLSIGRIVARCRVGVASPNPWLWALPIFLLLSALFASRARSPSMENGGSRSRNLDSFNFPRGTAALPHSFAYYISSVWLKARLYTWPLLVVER